MSRDEQIEKMARSLCLLKNATCEDCNMKEHCLMRNCAEGFYNAGYSKATTDFVEVVRCKDCKFNVANMEIEENDGTDYSGKDIVCSYFMTDGMEENDYCSRGERRTR